MIPNLDAMDRPALVAFHCRHRQGAAFRALFPLGGLGTKRATAALANYAANKATAAGLRQEGRDDRAADYEAICCRIRAALPPWAQW